MSSRACLALLAAAAGLGLGLGCITAFAPDIRRESHHDAMSPRSTRGDCLKCHETESHMAARMKKMPGPELARHMHEMQTVVRPSLVADWMVRDPRACVDCHRVKGGP